VLEKRRNLVLRDELDALIDGMAGMVLTKLQGCPHVWLAPILPPDGKAERVIFEIRKELAEAATRQADLDGEPPLNGQ
jgi:hypothetical protein